MWWLEQLWPNLVSEALGIAVAVFVIDRLIQRREEKRWAPARLVVARQVARTYATASSACFNAVAGLLQPGPNPHMTAERRATETFSKFLRQLQLLHHTVDLHNVALDATAMSDVAEFVEAADELLARLAFLQRLTVKPDPSRDLICDSPLEIVQRMNSKAERFRLTYPKSWDGSLIFSSAKTPAELMEIYDAAKYPALPLFLGPETYQFRDGRSPLVPDLDHLKRIKAKDMPVGTTIGCASE
jgi:hypothetical protein